MTFHAARPEYWRQVRGLSDAAKLAGAYLLNCDARRPGGLLRLRAEHAAADLEWPAKRVVAALAELLGAGLIVHDAEADLIYLTSWRIHDPLPGCGLAVSVARELLASGRAAPGSPAVLAAMGALREEAGRLLPVAKDSDTAAPRLRTLLTEMDTLHGAVSPSLPPSLPVPLPPSLPPSVGGTAGEERRGPERSGGSNILDPADVEDVTPEAGVPHPRSSGSRKRGATVPAKAVHLAPPRGHDSLLSPLTATFLNDATEPARLARLLRALIRERDPKAKMPLAGSRGEYAWWTEIERLHYIDGRDWPEIERIIRWCQADAFWRKNILSAGKLRKQFTALVAAAESDRGPDRRPNSADRPACPTVDAGNARRQHEAEMAAEGGAP